MSERTSPADHEQEFINYVRRKRGPCPDSETLIAFQQKALPLDQAEGIQSHVQLCGSCQVAMEMLERFEQAQAGELPEPPDWPKIERRSRQRFRAFLENQKVSSPVRPSLWEQLTAMLSWENLKIVFLHPALAYLLVVALAYPAYRGLFRQPEVVTVTVPEKQIVEVEKPGPDMANLTPVALKAPERAPPGEGPSVVRLKPDQPFVELAFQSPVSGSPRVVSDLEFYDSHGQVVSALKAVRPRDEYGNFILRCRRELFKPGRYELRVRVIDKSTQTVRAVDRFPFLVTEQ
jgi:hypothetical protein